MKKVYEGAVLFDSQDGGRALVGEFIFLANSIGTEESGLAIRIQSWDESLKHAEAEELRNKIVRVTVEVIA